MKITRRELRQIIISESTEDADYNGGADLELKIDKEPNLDAGNEPDSSIEKSLKMMFAVVKPTVFEIIAGIDAESLQSIITLTAEKLKSMGLSDPGKISRILTLLPSAIADGSITNAYKSNGVISVVDLIVDEIKNENKEEKQLQERKNMKITHKKLLSIIKEEIDYALEEGPTQADYDRRFNVDWKELEEQIKQGILHSMTILDFLKAYHGPDSKTQVVDINGQLVQAAPIDWEAAIEKSGVEGDEKVNAVIVKHPELKALLDVEGIVADQLAVRKMQHHQKYQSGAEISLAKGDKN